MKSKIIAISQYGLKVEDNKDWINANDFKTRDIIKTLKKGDTIEYDYFVKNDKQKFSKLMKVHGNTFLGVSSSNTPTKETKQAIGEYECSVCKTKFTEKKTSMLCEQNHYLKDIADTLRARM